MACQCQRPCADRCACSCHRFTSPEVAGAAGRRLSGLWDRARDLISRAGLRPYQVSIVRARSAGMRSRGDGPTEVVAEWPILPTPKVELTGIGEVMDADQLREGGTITMSGISLAYSEEVLLCRGATGQPIPPGETVFYEVRYLDGSGRITQRRRFVPNSAPSADMASAQWVIGLTRAPWDRDRAGVLR